MTRGVVAHGGSGWQLRQGGSHPRIGLESRFSVVEEMRRVGALPVSRHLAYQRTLRTLTTN